MATSSTRVFDAYESEYLKLTKAAATDVELVDQLLPGAEREKTAARAGKSIADAEEIVESMQLEARSLSGEARQQLVAQAKDYKNGIVALKQKLKAASTSSRAQEAQRAELLRGADPTLRMEADSQRDRLMANTDRLNRGTDKLRAAAQIALETEEVGASIMQDLESQRATIEHARGTLAGASRGLDRSRRLLQGMGRRAMQNRILMVVIIFVLILMISFIVWFNWLYHPAPPLPPCVAPPPPPDVTAATPYEGERACPPPPSFSPPPPPPPSSSPSPPAPVYSPVPPLPPYVPMG